MRLRELRKLVEQLSTGGGTGGGVPQLGDNETNILNMDDLTGTGLDVDGLLAGPGNFLLRNGIVQYNNTDGVLDSDTSYLVVATYVTNDFDVDWGGLDLVDDESHTARVAQLSGPASIDVSGLRSAVMPAGLDMNVILGTAGFRISNIQLFPLA